MIYEPREDSALLLKHIKTFAQDDILDMGTGSGVQAVEAAKYGRVIAVDVNPEALRLAKAYAKNSKITFVQSDLFSNVKGSYDLIIFNPPYLPIDKKHPDVALDGGKHGYELIWEFLSHARDFLKERGHVLMVFSNYTKRDKVDEALEKYLYSWELVDTQKIFHETLFVYDIVKSPLLHKLDAMNIKNVEKFAHGKRSHVFVGFLKNRKVAIKAWRRDDVSRIPIEATWLEKLNKKGIGPKLLSKNPLMYEFVEGEQIEDALEKGMR